MGTLIAGLKKDTSIDAFMSADHPAVTSRNHVEDIFGLRDPIIVAFIDETPNGIYDVESLNLLYWFSQAVAEIPNVDPDRIISLASATKIVNDDNVLLIEPFYDAPVTTQAEADAIHAAVNAMPVYVGSLVANDGKGALVSIELLDQSIANETYHHVLELVSEAPAGATIHVAGEAAVSGYLSEYLNRDSRKLVPLGFLGVFAIVFLAFRTWAGIGLSFVVVAASIVSAMGFMAAFGVPYYVITNAMPSILVGISVADSVHIMSAYYETRAEDESGDTRAQAWGALRSILRPVFFTTLTTIFGFSGIVLSSSMPPMFWFGVFSIVGLCFALIYSVLFLPAGLGIFGQKKSAVFIRRRKSPGLIIRGLSSIGLASANNPRFVVALAALIVLGGLIGASHIKVDREQIGQFQQHEPIVDADRAINAHFNGSNSLHVVVESKDESSLLTRERLNKMAALEDFALTLPHVHGAVSIVNYIEQVNSALMQSDGEIPESDELLAQQYFLLTAGSNPTEWEDEIDALQQRALIKINVSSGRYSDSRAIIQAMQGYIDREFSDDDLNVYLSGRINTDYHWLKPLAKEHVVSIIVSLFLVLLAAVFLFRSVLMGVAAVVPVILSITVVYAVMGYFGIWLDAATSMFATIAIGLGVDFGIHAIDRVQDRRRQTGEDLPSALEYFFATSGQALFVNFFALFVCFCVIASSALPTMERFGSICALAIFISFISSVTVIPAILSLFNKVKNPAGFSQPVTTGAP